MQAISFIFHIQNRSAKRRAMPTGRRSSSGTTNPKGSKRSTTSGTVSTQSASVPSSLGQKSRGEKRTPDKQHSSRASGTADDDSTTVQNEPGDTPASLPPKHLFVIGSNNVQTVGDEVTVSALVAKRIFPHVKFVCNPLEELAFTNDARSICGIVRAYCNPPENIPATEWWQTVRKWVGRQIAIQRSIKNTKLKWTFMGTYALVFYCHC